MESFANFKGNFTHDSSNKWTLADDVELLKNLERFSEAIIKNATIAKKCVDNLEENLTLTYLKVKKLSNDLNAVGNNKFIENRALDEDESVESDVSEKMDFTSGNQPIINDKLDESLSTCIRLLEDKFETVQLSESDSDDEGLEHSQVVLKPRKCYVERPLPHVIGSYKFLNDSTLGLSLILQEHEDSIETEDEGGNLLVGFNEEVPKLPSQVDQIDESVSLSRKSQDDSLSSYEVITNQGLFPGKQPSFKSFALHNEQTCNDNDDLESSTSISDTYFTQKKTISPNSDFFIPIGTSRKSEDCVKNSPIAEEDKPYSKETMKSVLQQIYSSPPTDNRFSKNMLKTGLMDTVGEKKTETKHKPEDSEEVVKSDQKPHTTVLINDRFANDSPKLVTTTTTTTTQSHADDKDDDLLPNLSTETLKNLSKNRARNQKKRPPSRKKRDMRDSSSSSLVSDLFPPKLPDEDFTVEPQKSIPEEEMTNISPTPNTNLLSPATDEEDLFTVCNSTIPNDLSSDRLFQPFTFKQTSSTSKRSPLKPELSSQIQQQKSSFWDPFSEDDDASFFKTSTSWSSHKFSKRSEQLSDLVSSPSDENLFIQKNDQNKRSLFDEPLVSKTKSVITSLFDEPDDDDSLFSTPIEKPNTSRGDSTKKSKGLEETSSSSKTSGFTSKSNFLSDPLGFSQDCDNE